MAKKALFEFVLIHHPPETKDAQGNDTSEPDKLIQVNGQDVTRVLAKDQPQVATIASREIPKEFVEKLEEVEIRIRPF